jgi:ADP-ribosylglycohydrolase
MNRDRIVGCLIGGAVGDALGLPYEGLSRRRAAKMLGPPDRHRLFFGRGMVSDDTEHACLTAQSLVKAGGDLKAFRNSLARGLRHWLLGLPAGIGLATLRSILRLWIGYSPERSGVFSAGNGPAMRAAILGASVANPESLREFVRASSRITHSDPKAEYGAFAVALATQMASNGQSFTPGRYLQELRSLLPSDAQELILLLDRAVASVNEGHSTEQFADSLGLTSRVSGYTYHSVPVAIHAWLSHPRDFRSAILSVILCGGDTDTTAAMVGGIVGASVTQEGIPKDWIDNLMEWPRTASWMERLGTQLGAQAGQVAVPIRLPVAGLVARNLFFLAIVFYHGFRRLAPPY